MSVNLRIHPAIGFARVGNSQEYYIEPQTVAAMPQAGQATTGGLPVKPGTNSTTITSSDIRDAQRKLKRQASRFKIYQYPEQATTTYPSPKGEEVILGSIVDGKKVIDIIWTVHLANKKANYWEHAHEGLVSYENDKTPTLRNDTFNSGNPADPVRLKKLVIDAGPRSIRASGNDIAAFDKETQASYWDSGQMAIASLPDYPQSYPAADNVGINT